MPDSTSERNSRAAAVSGVPVPRPGRRPHGRGLHRHEHGPMTGGPRPTPGPAVIAAGPGRSSGCRPRRRAHTPARRCGSSSAARSTGGGVPVCAQTWPSAAAPRARESGSALFAGARGGAACGAGRRGRCSTRGSRWARSPGAARPRRWARRRCPAWAAARRSWPCRRSYGPGCPGQRQHDVRIPPVRRARASKPDEHDDDLHRTAHRRARPEGTAYDGRRGPPRGPLHRQRGRRAPALLPGPQ
ncbi:hypothetical protein SVIOM74S_01737 [Streptomyces violarus]